MKFMENIKLNYCDLPKNHLILINKRLERNLKIIANLLVKDDCHGNEFRNIQ